MSGHRGTETTFELTTIERLEQLRYQHVFGPEIVRAIGRVTEFEWRVGPLYQSIENNERQSRTLAAIRDALLPKLLSGKIRAKPLESKLAQPPVG